MPKNILNTLEARPMGGCPGIYIKQLKLDQWEDAQVYIKHLKLDQWEDAQVYIKHT